MRPICRFVNETCEPKYVTNFVVFCPIHTNQPVEVDEDSDAEKLSPLLDPKKNEGFNNNKIPNSALHIEGVDESIDDTDTEVEDHEEVRNNVFILFVLEWLSLITGTHVSFLFYRKNPGPF